MRPRVFISAGISGISPVTGFFGTHDYKEIWAGIYPYIYNILEF
jgi:hypothetical protein